MAIKKDPSLDQPQGGSKLSFGLWVLFGLVIIVVLSFMYNWLRPADYSNISLTEGLTTPASREPVGSIEAEKIVPPNGQAALAPGVLAQEEIDNVEIIVGTRNASGATAVEDLLVASPEQLEGQLIKIKGEVEQVLLPAGFILGPQNDIEGEEGIVVVYRAGDLIGTAPQAGAQAVVEGQLLRLNMAEIEHTIGIDAVNKAVFAPYEGKPAIIASPLSH